MKIKSSLHNHSAFDDGKSTIKEMVEAAIELGFTDFGFSGHSTNLDFFEGWGMTDEGGYIDKVLKVKEAYKEKINIYLGLEQDLLGPTTRRDEYDYIIASVHGFTTPDGKKYYSVDDTLAEIKAGIDDVYNGDPYLMLEDYFANVVKNVKTFKPEIIGHFDLPVKLNGGNDIFDEENERYVQAALNAVEKCIELGGIFEVNTGGIYRGYRDAPYPAPFILKKILECGGRVMINADSHITTSIDYKFEESVELIKEIGFKTVAVYLNGAFENIAID